MVRVVATIAAEDVRSGEPHRTLRAGSADDRPWSATSYLGPMAHGGGVGVAVGVGVDGVGVGVGVAVGVGGGGVGVGAGVAVGVGVGLLPAIVSRWSWTYCP